MFSCCLEDVKFENGTVGLACIRNLCSTFVWTDTAILGITDKRRFYICPPYRGTKKNWLCLTHTQKKVTHRIINKPQFAALSTKNIYGLVSLLVRR